MQTAYKFQSEEFNGFSAACEHVVDDVVVLSKIGFPRAFHKGYSIFDLSNVVRRQVEVFASKFVYDGVNLHDSGLDAVLYQRGRSGADPEATVKRVS